MTIKPKNRVYCVLSQRSKMVFKTKEEADRFIKFNTANPEEWDEGKVPIRSYYCVGCGGYHVTSKRDKVHEESFDIQQQEHIIDEAVRIYGINIPGTKPPESKFKDKVKNLNTIVGWLRYTFGKKRGIPEESELTKAEEKMEFIREEIEGPLKNYLTLEKKMSYEKIIKEIEQKVDYYKECKQIPILMKKLRETEILLAFGMIEESMEQIHEVGEEVKRIEKEEKVKYPLDEIKSLMKYYLRKIEELKK